MTLCMNPSVSRLKQGLIDHSNIGKRPCLLLQTFNLIVTLTKEMDVNTFMQRSAFLSCGSCSKFPPEARGPSVEPSSAAVSLTTYESWSLVSLGRGQLKQSVAVPYMRSNSKV